MWEKKKKEFRLKRERTPRGKITRPENAVRSRVCHVSVSLMQKKKVLCS